MSSFEWDPEKDAENQEKHGVSFADAQNAFLDSKRIVAADLTHSTPEEARYFCFGEWNGGILTVRFTFRGEAIRIIGAGYWRRGKKIYAEENQVHGRTAGPSKGSA